MMKWLVVCCMAVAAAGAQETGAYVPSGYEVVASTEGNGFGSQERCGEGAQEGRFRCVVYHRCNGKTNMIIPEEVKDGSTINKDGFGIIDIRFGVNSCTNPLDVCCGIPSNTQTTSTTTTTESSPPISTEKPQLPVCGIRNVNGIDFKITGDKDNEAEYGEFPWMMAILKQHYNPSSDKTLAICGGSLIAPNIILTGAHCVEKYKISDLKVRAGEWDTQTTRERLPYQERNVAEILVHPDFNPKTLFNDFALLRLESDFTPAAHIATVCLPEPNETPLNATECYASGWGKDVFGQSGQFQVILKKLRLPLVAREACERALRRTRLGHNFRLDGSFVCAGGEAGRDTCTGDGGSPLVCADPTNPKRYLQAGIVAWGIGCGEDGTPGVYADVAKGRGWIDEQLERLNVDSKYYTEYDTFLSRYL